jgi:hypothetical protein
MEQSKVASKFVAFLPAIVLVGGLVAYRAGAFQPRSSVEPQPVQVVMPPPPDPQAGNDSQQPQFMYGSKSAMPVPPSQLGSPGGAQQPGPNPTITQVNPAFMGGSKSIIILEPSKGMPQPAPPVYMGGSKFKAVLSPDELKPPPMPEPRKP